jgi:hypothetical protein
MKTPDKDFPHTEKLAEATKRNISANTNRYTVVFDMCLQKTLNGLKIKFLINFMDYPSLLK